MSGIEGLRLGRYELRRRIAQGGMAEVYLAYDRRVRRQIAIKVLYGRDESFIRRFEREALAVGALSHDHILPLYDFGEQRPWYYLVMPYIEGGTLRDYLHSKQRLPLVEAASFVDQIASALQYAHDQGVMHRDVKPSNILLRPDGYAYLVDFGLAKALLGGEPLSSAGAMVGTPEYMAPEQSNGINDYRSDIYSLGVILYQMLTGRVPFTAESPVAVSLKHIQIKPTPPSQVNPEIPASVEEVILKALAKDPDLRYQQAQAFSTAYWKALHRERLWTTGKLVVAESGEIRALRSFSELSPQSDATDDALPARTSEASERAITKENTAKSERTWAVDHEGRPYRPRVTAKQAIARPDTRISPASFPTRNRIRHSTFALLGLTGLILLMTLLPLGLGWQAAHPSGIRPVQSAGTAQQSILHWNRARTATANAQTTAQAQAQATLAAQARVKATAGITSSIGAGHAIYGTSLTSPGGGWIDDGYQCFFSPQGYHVQTHTAPAAAWCYSNHQQFSNVVITARAQLLRGDIYGLVFRLSPISRTFYVLELNKYGEYRFVRAYGSDPYNWLTLIDWTPSTAIQSGYGHTNTILVLTTGPHYRFYINKQLIVSSFTDSAYTTGLLGFLVAGDTPTGTEAVFSNVWVFQK